MKIFLQIISIVLFTLLSVTAVLYFYPDLPKNLFTGMPITDTGCDSSILKTSKDFQYAASDYEEKGDYKCAIKLWEKVIEKRPTDVSALASLALLLSQNEYHQESLPYYQKILKMGAGDADVFAWYARSLRELQKMPDAINWYYRTLSIEPELEDITSEITELLALDNRFYEAVNLLTGYEELTDSPDYFSARKIALQVALDNISDLGEEKSFRVAKLYNNHFHIAAYISNNKNHKAKVFIVDTGASSLTLSQSWLKKSKAKYSVIKPHIRAKIANGKVLVAKLIRLPYFKFGPFELHNVKAFVCAGCQPLIGQNILNRFDMSTKRVNGVDFLHLKKRAE